MEKAQVKTFLELVSSMSSYGDFERRLGLSQRDVETEKARLGVQDHDDAKRLLQEMFGQVENTLKLDKERLQEQKEREKRLRSLTKAREQTGVELSKHVHAGGGGRTQAEMNAALNKLTDAANLSDAEVPEIEDEEKFIQDSKHGLAFLRQKYSLTSKEALAVARKLNIKDLLE